MKNPLRTRRIVPSVRYLLILSVLTLASYGSQGQMADSNFDTKVVRPAYVTQHPKILFDEAHRNIHTASGLYKPFIDLISNDGYQVTANKKPFSSKALDSFSLLVIANALGANEGNDNPAFSDEECDVVRDWVQAGGSLLLITDHAPTGSAAEILSKRFGVEMSKGIVEDPKNYDNSSGDLSQLVFTRQNALILEHPIT